MAAAISSFRNRIIPYVPGCPIPAVDRAVVDAMRQLCEETNCFAKTIGATGNAPTDEFPFVFPIVLDTTTGDYYIAAVDLTQYTELTGYDPVMPVYFVVDGAEEHLKYLDAENEVTDLDDIVPKNTRFYRFDDTETLHIYPYETVAESEVDMIITLSMKPSDGATSVADVFLNDWRNAIVALTSSELQRIPERKWTDLNQAQINRQIYQDERSKINFNRGSFYHRKTRFSGGYI